MSEMDGSKQRNKRRRLFFMTLAVGLIIVATVFLSLQARTTQEQTELADQAQNQNQGQEPPDVAESAVPKESSSSKPEIIPRESDIPTNESDIPTNEPDVAPSALEPPIIESTAAQRTPISWYYMKKGAGKVPDFPLVNVFRADQNVLWIGDGNNVYLTIDMGADLGDPERWLQILAQHQVKVTYFVTGENIRRNPELMRRLLAEGHLVANHSLRHPDFTTLPDSEVRAEIEQTAALYKDATGLEAPKLFRFPYGKYSDHLLNLLSHMGYTSVFWSTAMKDWVPREHGAADVISDVMGNLHAGNVILMHQASADNLNALDDLIRQIKSKGYRFALIGE
jgi:peptidoglycan-N-acetylmuramic acid deacetylase